MGGVCAPAANWISNDPVPECLSAVVTAGVVGTGIVRRPHHVHWQVVGRIAIGYALSLPASMGVGAALFVVLDQIDNAMGG